MFYGFLKYYEKYVPITNQPTSKLINDYFFRVNLDFIQILQLAVVCHYYSYFQMCIFFFFFLHFPMPCLRNSNFVVNSIQLLIFILPQP